MSTKIAPAAALAALLLVPSTAAPQDPPPPTQQIKGTVVALSGTALRVKLASGRVEVYTLAGEAAARAKDLKPGWRVVATVQTDQRSRSIVGFADIAPPLRTGGSTGGGGEPAARRSKILITTDLACEVSVDFKKVVSLPAGGHATIEVEPGERMITAVTPDGATRNQKVKVGGEQAIVELVLAGAAVAATAAQLDASAAQVVAALADVRGAGSYVAWVLEKKAFGYQNVQLTVSLQRAATRLQRELEKLKALKPPEAQRGGAQQELARAGGEAERYAALLTEAATTAQSEGTSFGKSAQLRGQALAHLPLMTPDARALAPVQASPDFRAGLTPDRWPDAGLTADPQDFRLGAEYDGDTPPRLGAVAKGGLADSMGLRPGDRLLAVDGRPVQSVWAFKAALRGVAGRTAQIELEREGKRETKKAAVPATLSAAR